MMDYKAKYDKPQYQIPYWISRLEEIIDNIKQESSPDYAFQEKYRIYKEKGH